MRPFFFREVKDFSGSDSPGPGPVQRKRDCPLAVSLRPRFSRPSFPDPDLFRPGIQRAVPSLVANPGNGCLARAMWLLVVVTWHHHRPCEERTRGSVSFSKWPGAGDNGGMSDNPFAHLQRLVVETGPEPRHAVIWLHGLGADGHDFEPIVPELAPQLPVPVRFVFPHAPLMPVTINGGQPMRAWYDFLTLEPGRGENRRHLQQAVEAVNGLVAEQVAAGIERGHIVLAGFSQGGVIALLAALAAGQPLAGAMGLSTYLPLREAEPLPCRGLPVFLAHGDLDEVLPFFLGLRARDRLQAAGCRVTWHEYPMGHAVCSEEIAHIGQWLAGVLNEPRGG